MHTNEEGGPRREKKLTRESEDEGGIARKRDFEDRISKYLSRGSFETRGVGTYRVA